MTNQVYSLSKLHDIVVPEPVSWWPPAPGVWVLLCLAAVVVIALAWRFLRSWRSNAYRRAGLALLADAGTAYDISVILKRVALAAFPREQVASLHGQDWAAFLNQTCTQCDFLKVLTDETASEKLMAQSRVWITRHSTVRSEPLTPDP
jgi:hypothetical protein